MARSENQKKKLFRLLEIFINDTDESHGVSMKEIIERLERDGIRAERKSIYDDIMTLSELGFDIITLPEKPPKYTLLSRPFELAELKMLVDSVEASKFITREQSREIIGKLKKYAGKYHSHELSRQVYVEDRVKTPNTLSIENIDLIHKAINASSVIRFHYFDYTREKKRIFRHGGKLYKVSPEALVLSDENYYLVAYDAEAETHKNFRVDKMVDIELTGEPRDAAVTSNRFNSAEYSRKIFGMYGGEEALVTLECREHLAGVIIDRFGTDSSFFSTDFGFKTSVRVMVSPNFFAWVLSFGEDMRILAPKAVRDNLAQRLTRICDYYGEVDNE